MVFMETALHVLILISSTCMLVQIFKKIYIFNVNLPAMFFADLLTQFCFNSSWSNVSLSLFFSLFSPVPLLLSLFFCPIFCMLSWTLQKNLAGMVTFCSCLSSYNLYRHTRAGVCLCVRERARESHAE